MVRSSPLCWVYSWVAVGSRSAVLGLACSRQPAPDSSSEGAVFITGVALSTGTAFSDTTSGLETVRGIVGVKFVTIGISSSSVLLSSSVVGGGRVSAICRRGCRRVAEDVALAGGSSTGR